ncbi:RNA recognition motif [Rhizoctonia solani]|uniref:RNA recognition motif n=1 Tax=Rhizoctonia solani TaxID=456999 RepID=A0A8H7IE57_9AGAM|nr:RNA recognition motif [Rhizoctonia solani]
MASPKPKMTASEPVLQVLKTADFNITAPNLFRSKLILLPSLGLPESSSTEGINVSTVTEDVLSTPTPSSITSFAHLVKSTCQISESDSQSADVSMLSMTDDDSEISSADLENLDISPTGGLGGGVLCGIPSTKHAESASQTEASPKGNRYLEGLVPHNEPPKPKHRPFPPQRSCNIHIQNLPEHYEDAELSALCEEFGHIVSVRVFRRPVSAPPSRRLPDGQHSTYGFVLFDNINSAENCVNTLRRRYKNIYPSFARQAAPAVHQPAFVGLLEAMAFGDLHGADSNLEGLEQWSNADTVSDPHSQYDPGQTLWDLSITPQLMTFLGSLSRLLWLASGLPITFNRRFHQANAAPIQSYIAPSTTMDRINSILNSKSILLIVDGLPKDFGVGLLDTLFAPHEIHDVRLHRKGPTGAVRGSVRVSNRLAALQSIEKLTGMQFGGLAGGLHVRLAEEVPGDHGENDSGSTAPTLPSYRTLPDVQEYQSMLAPPIHPALVASTSAPAVTSMLGSGLNALLFASESCADGLIAGSQMAAPVLQVSPSTGGIFTSPARLQVPFTPGLSNSISMPQVAPRFIGQGQQMGLSPSLRVGNITLPINNVISSEKSLYASPVIKVTSYAGVVKKPVVALDPPPKDGTGTDGKKKRKGSRVTKGSGRGDAKELPEEGSKPLMNKKSAISDTVDNNTTTESPSVGPTKLTSNQPKSAASKAKKWLATRRRTGSKSAAAKA